MTIEQPPLGAAASEPVHWQPCWTQQFGDHPSGLVWHPDGRRLAAASLGGDVIVFEAGNGRRIHEADRSASATCLAWAGDHVVTGYDDGTITIDDRPIRLRGWIHDLAARPDVVAIAHGRHVSLLDLVDRGDEPQPLAEHPTSITSVVWHPTEPKLIMGSHNRLETLDITTGAVEPVPLTWGGAVASVRGGRDHDWWVAGVRGDWGYAWQLSKSGRTHVLPVPRATGTLVAVDPSRPRCVIASPQMTALFDMSISTDDHQPSGQWLFSLGTPTAVTWHPTRPVLLCGVTVHEPPGGAGILRWEPDHDPVPVGCILSPERVVNLEWSPDGSLLAVGLADGTIAVLEAAYAAP